MSDLAFESVNQGGSDYEDVVFSAGNTTFDVIGSDNIPVAKPLNCTPVIIVQILFVPIKSVDKKAGRVSIQCLWHVDEIVKSRTNFVQLQASPHLCLRSNSLSYPQIPGNTSGISSGVVFRLS